MGSGYGCGRVRSPRCPRVPSGSAVALLGSGAPVISRLKKRLIRLASTRWALIAMILAGLAATGATLSFIIAPVREGMRVRQPALRLDASGAGQGATLAILGGFRALVADLAWIRMYAVWERRDLPGTETLLRLVTTIDPRPVYFWLNAARITAYDFPFWRILAAGGFEQVPEEVQQRLSHEQSRSALRGLETAMRFHPASVELWVERANIELNRLRDLDAAAESYRRAWQLPGAPYYVARLRAEVLRRAGRRAEALEWLLRLHPTLPPADEGAAAELVLGRIRDLERELGVPADRVYRGPAARE